MSAANKKVSVVVAVYNAAPFLRQCLDSIVNQTLKNLEIICVNDGSNDDSGVILAGYAASDRRIKILSKENEGLGGAPARNLGLSQATGDYVSILDSDDFFEPTMLEKAVLRAEETGADIVVFGGYEYDQMKGSSVPVGSILNVNALPDKEIFSYRDVSESIFQISAGMAWNKLYRRSFLARHNLCFQPIKYTDDAYFTFAHMVLAEKIAALPENLCHYRVNSGVNQTAGLAAYPDSAYLPYLALKKSLAAWGIYPAVERSLLNCAVAFMRYFYDKITGYKPFAYLHQKLRDEIFKELAITEKPVEFFFHAKSFQWCQQIINHTPEELVFMAARAYGSDCTTGILRFQFPYDVVPKGSKIILMGSGIMAVHYYAQMVLNGYCEVVACVSQENPLNLPYRRELAAIADVNFDYILIACEKPWLVHPALEFFHELGISNDKIIGGGI